MKINDKYMDLVDRKFKLFYCLYQTGLIRSYEDYKKWQVEGLIDAVLWGSHQPALIHLLNTIITGPVLEFGMGVHSTPMLHFICEQQGRRLESFEFSDRWLRKFYKYRNKKHSMNLFEIEEVKNDFCNFLHKKYSIVFIDAHPAEMRQIVIDKMKGKVDYFIVHDTENVVLNKPCPYKYDFSSFKHVLHFKGVHPMTTILSDLEEININLLTIFNT